VSTTTPIGEFTEPSPRSYRITIRCPEYEFTRIKALGSSVASELDVLHPQAGRIAFFASFHRLVEISSGSVGMDLSDGFSRKVSE
jgi:hypothetical protein